MPRRKPTHLKILEGADERNIPRGEPVPTSPEGSIRPPYVLSDGAQAYWDALAGDLTAKNVLTAWDSPQFANLCDWLARCDVIRERLGDEFTVEGSRKGSVVKNPLLNALRDAQAMVNTLAARFGLTPSDRGGLAPRGGDQQPSVNDPSRLLS
ncbi:P27 family phage terminase small subunit [Gordonia sp. SND2]|uniref:P27 family phage terminase small subunit n=1 Tax=Gordonia sp. SND2 TaxID=3388659 RepID=UPI00398ACFE4